MKHAAVAFICLLIVLWGGAVEANAQPVTYIVELDSAVAFGSFRLPSGYVDLTALRAASKDGLITTNPILAAIREVLTDVKIISVRKLIRRLPESLSKLTTKRGTVVSANHWHSLLVVDRSAAYTDEEIKTLKGGKVHVRDIVKNWTLQSQTWPPTDTYYTSQPEFFSSLYNINLPRAWQYNTGRSDVQIAVVDQGVDYRHSELGAGFGGTYRVSGGWDYTDNDNNPLPDYGSAYEEHGTPVAGILGMQNNNSAGGVSLAGGWITMSTGCRLLSLRISNTIPTDRSPDPALLREAVFEAATDPAFNQGFGFNADVINCSQGGDASYPDFLWWCQNFYDAFAWAYENNVFVAAARGNGNTTAPFYPASFAHGDALAAISGVNVATGLRHSSSRYGSEVTLSAPYTIGWTTKNNFGSGSFDGTSCATPFVSGAAALVISQLRDRGYSPYAEDVREILKISAQEAGPTGYDWEYGWGRLDAGQALYLSSEPFRLVHATASESRTVTAVTPPQTLSILYPFCVVIPTDARKITASITIPTDYAIDSAWAWGNAYSDGTKWENPSYGLAGASFVSKVGRTFTFEMYTYFLYPLGGGSPIGWWPCDPNSGQIKVSYLGKYAPPPPPPLTVTISGPSSLGYKEQGTFTANASGGSGNYAYQWYRAYDYNPSNWTSMGTNRTQTATMVYDDFTMRCDVHDNGTGQNVSASRHVSYGDALINPPIVEQSVPTENLLHEATPNPFNPTTTLRVGLASDSHLSLRLYDILGREVAQLADGWYQRGYHSIVWDARALSSGIYYARIIVADQSGKMSYIKTNKLVLAK